MERYVFSVLRFVPDPARGEFVNIGAIAGSDETKEWQVRTIENMRRARYFDDIGVVSNVFAFINEIGRRLDSFTEAWGGLIAPDDDVSEEWLARLYSESGNLIQLSQPAPMVAESIEDAMEEVFGVFVVDPKTLRANGLTKHAALASLRKAYKRSGLQVGNDVLEKVKVSGRHHSGFFDFVVTNGQAVQLAQTWSFQVADMDSLGENIKAFAWTVHDLRGDGGEIRRNGELVEVAATVPVDVLYVRPTNEKGKEAFAEAKSAFKEVDVRLYERSAADQIATQAADLLRPGN